MMTIEGLGRGAKEADGYLQVGVEQRCLFLSSARSGGRT
jgi:hypothetical protein